MKAVSFGGISVLAVGIVVALALVGISHAHSQVVTKVRTPTPAQDPSLSSPRANRGVRQVTYVNSTQSMAYAGTNRSYVISRPSTLSTTTKLPVIVVLHGRDVTPAFEEQRTNLTSVVNPSILVYPTGYQQSWNAGGCCGQAQTANIDDVGFLKAVLARVKAGQPDANQGQAYLVGYSNGGKLALRLACVDAGDFSGVAVYGATDSGACPNRAPAQMLIMAGALDTEIPATSASPPPQPNGFVPPSFQAEVTSYRVADGCAATPVVTTVGQVTLTSWVHCSGNERVGQAVFANGTHDWPVGSATSPSGEGVAWAWFQSLGA
jgi:polyhydroxybutyrate depolymerase